MIDDFIIVLNLHATGYAHSLFVAVPYDVCKRQSIASAAIEDKRAIHEKCS